MSEIIKLILGNAVVRWILGILALILVLFGLYNAGKYAQRKITETVNAAQDQLMAAMQKNIQSNFDAQFGTLQGSLTTQFAAIKESLEDNKNAIENDRSTLGNLNNVWMRVDGVSPTNPVTNSGNKALSTPTNSSGSNGTYYAKLSDSTLQFLKGEAYRGDQCAVRLTAAQQALVQYQGAFEKYQQIVTDALTSAKIK